MYNNFAGNDNGLISDLKHRPLELRLFPDEVLREKAEPVGIFDTDLLDFANEMLALMLRRGGIGLAAPQVGVLRRIVVAGNTRDAICLVNPEIVHSSGRDSMVEGCLSLPNQQFDISRRTEIEITGHDLKGGNVHFSLEGLMARVLQHEIDHLDGVLVCDHGIAVSGEDSL